MKLMLLHVFLFLIAKISIIVPYEVIGEDGFDFSDIISANHQEHVNEPAFQWFRVVTAEIGKLLLFPLPIQNNAFEAKRKNYTKLPYWLIFERKTGIFMGVPLDKDTETLELTFYINPSHAEDLTIKVINRSSLDDRKCVFDKKPKIVEFLINMNTSEIKPVQRILIISNGAKYLGISTVFIKMTPYSENNNTLVYKPLKSWSSFLKPTSGITGTLIEAQIGCDFGAYGSLNKLVKRLKLHSADDTLSSMLGFPLIGWNINVNISHKTKRDAAIEDDYGSGDYDEEYYDDYDEDPEGDENGRDVENNVEIDKPEQRTTFDITTETTISTMHALPTHSHRHHHGESKFGDDFLPEVSETQDHYPRFNQSLTQVPHATHLVPTMTTQIIVPNKKNAKPRPDDTANYEDGDYAWSYDDLEDTDNVVESKTDFSVTVKKTSTNTKKNITQSFTTDAATNKETTLIDPEQTTTPKPISVTSTKTITIKDELTKFQIINETGPEIIYTTENTTPVPNTSLSITRLIGSFTSNTQTPFVTEPTTITVNTESTTLKTINIIETIIPVTFKAITVTDTSLISTTNIQTSSVKSITETVELDVTEPRVQPVTPVSKNYGPFIENRLQYLSVTAGKVFRFVIPANTFNDVEDGYNLTLQVLDNNEQLLPKNSWIQFNPLRRELYGLPLAEHVSNWVYIIKAKDIEGIYEQDQMTIQVQQHPLEKVVNHEFSMVLRIEKLQEFPHYVDWSLKVLRALGKIYETNMSEITVRHINTTTEVATFTWTNDSLPTAYCPRHDIEKLFKILTANDRGDPSRELSMFLAPSLRVKKVVYYDLGICTKQTPPLVTSSTNFSPILRNPVDKVNASLNELLVFKVKDDTFYDPEDVDPSMLNITLLTSDFKLIPPTNWLQFDSKNREFFGIPRKVSKSQYWLVCVDTGGMSARDSLEVEVYSSPKRHYNVEFSMTIEVPFDTFSNSAILQRKFTEKLMELFDDFDAGNFHFPMFKQKRDPIESTVIYWFNKSLPLEKCPTDEIKRLEYILHNSDQKSIASKVHRIMSPEFTVSTIKVHHLGNCKTKPQPIPIPENIIPVEASTPPAPEKEVLITFILPAIIIVIMLFIAAFAACVLYQRRRSGKISLEEDGRQSYRNKGIPVIFQEELDEKPEPGTKTPVILKDEKPPLAPPEYSRSGSLKLDDSEPYQPPPPFTRNQDTIKQNRPKPTPTYRKPPPYVPP